MLCEKVGLSLSDFLIADNKESQVIRTLHMFTVSVRMSCVESQLSEMFGRIKSSLPEVHKVRGLTFWSSLPPAHSYRFKSCILGVYLMDEELVWTLLRCLERK